MKKSTAAYLVSFCLLSSLLSTPAQANELLTRKTKSGTIVGYQDTPMLPSNFHVHDPDRPIPAQVTPGRSSTDEQVGSAPSDAIVLFDGGDLAQFEPCEWEIDRGATVAGHGDLITRASFGDCQLHLEWMTPTAAPSRMMNRGNSGVILMGAYEVQIFDSHAVHAEQIYPDGQAASIYGQTPPAVNSCRAPGKWQSFDIVFTAPVFEGGQLSKPAFVTMFHNGVLVHLNQEVNGPMAHCRIVPYVAHAAKLPLVIQGHGSPVRFRNIWIRELGD